jgi:ribosomal protein L11 methyltransferase
MEYIEINITGFTGFDPEIVIAQLAELGFESFSESDAGLQGYVRKDLYQEVQVLEYLRDVSGEHGLQWSVQEIGDQNWNALWESAYEPVTIAGKCRVRAPFHLPDPDIRYEIVIEPRMSFGTAHHETTALMIDLLMQESVEGKRVLDMGCGTGILAILAGKMLAAEVIAIDNDDWAFANAMDNMVKNDVPRIRVIQGEAGNIPLPEYDLIAANINRNVLLEDIVTYARFLNPGGVLLLSGFYLADLDMIRSEAEKCGLHYSNHKADHSWVGARFIK